MKLSKILFATDFSGPAEEAGKHAIALARRHGAEVVFAHAHPLSNVRTNRAEEFLGREPFRRTLAKALSDVHGLLAAARDNATDGAVTSQVLVDEPIAEGLRKATAELGCELVVAGSHGRTGLARLGLGSVAEKLVRTQEVPVLVARHAPPRDGYTRILVPVDHSTLSPRQVELALALATDDADIILLHCWSMPFVSYGAFAEQAPGMTELSEDTRREAARENVELIARFPSAIQRFSSAVVASSASLGIQSFLKERGPFDLVVVGSHNPGPAARVFFGSTASAIVRHAPCSVLVAR